MSNKKEQKKKYLSIYEHNAMWMSYRYAIGRNTITSTMHAGYMIQNVYERIPEEQVEIDVFDIRREINRALEFEFNFGLEIDTPQQYYEPFKALVQLDKKIEKELGIGLLNYLKDHKITAKINQNNEYDFINGLPIYPGHEKYEMKLHDLIIWANMANALDPNKHHTIITKYYGNEETHDVFESYMYDKIKGFSVNYTDIKSYLENPFKYTYLAPDCIIKIDDNKYEFNKTN